jgi:hypothetical protein
VSKHPQPAPGSSSVTSATPQRLPKKQKELFRDVLTYLSESEIPFAVSGAIALQQHTGICRNTKDLDIFLAAENGGNALACLRKHGLRCEIRDPVWLAKVYRDKYFVDLITGMSNAVITVDESWITNSYPGNILGVPVRLLAPEELLVSKLFVTRRERFDGADIAHIIYASEGKLDWERILKHAGEHWEILFWSLVLFRYVYPGNSDFVPASLWKNLIERFAQATSHPDPHQEFRGSLIDDHMFAIDVKEWGLENILARYRAERTPTLTMPSEHDAVGCGK